MTQEALKMALEALEVDAYVYNGEKSWKAITALKEALAEHAMRETQRLGQEIEQEPVIGKWSLREVYFDEDGEPTMHRSPPQPERHELQAKGEHPAPCARHCEANAFQIVIKNLKAQLAQPEQEPVATDWNAVHEKLALVWYRELSADEGLDEIQDLINTTPPQRTWVELTDEQIEDCYKQGGIGRAIQLFKEKNT